jgi:hypothetical protein
VAFIQNLFTSRDNNSNSATYVGQQDRLWWDPVTNRFYYSDGVTPGGFPVNGGGNTVTNKLVNGTYELVLDAAGNVTAPGAISAVGNVTANYFIGDGSQLTNLPVGGSNITVQNQGNTLTSALNTMNFTGNGVVATNVGNVVTVTVTAGSGTQLPSQTGNAEKFLQTTGTDLVWKYVAGIFGLTVDGGTAYNTSNCLVINGGGA